ncbi:MAG: hypothetical protein ACFB2Z_15215 [Maricaulaceae bacterium]
MNVTKERVLGRQLADELTAAELEAVSGGSVLCGPTLTKEVGDPDDQTWIGGGGTALDEIGQFP